MNNKCILVIPDLHFPYCHPDSLDFLAAIKKKIKPTRVICLGDELDYHAYSFHNHDPDLDSAGVELLKALGYMETLFKLFPRIDFLESNHGSMAYRKAKFHGTPRHLLKSYHDVLGAPKECKWHDELIIKLPDGRFCLFNHALGSDILSMGHFKGMCVVQGHYHSLFEIRSWDNGIHKLFAMSSGCLVNNKSLAMAYNKALPKAVPVIGASAIIDSEPVLFKMKMDKNNRWTGKL